MKHFVIFLIIFTIKSNISFSQDSPKHQAAYVEGFGGGIIFSFNYESRFQSKPNGFGYRIGLGLTGIDGIRVITAPLGINYLLGKKKNFLEIGAGVTLVGLSDTQMTTSNSSLIPDVGAINGFFNLGYRRVFDSGIMIKAGISPLFTPEEILLLWPHLGFGFHF